MVEYAVLSLLLLRAFRRTWPRRSSQAWVWSALLAVLYAVSDEYHQSFVAGRENSLQDILIDVGGIALALVFFRNRLAMNRIAPNGT